MEVLIAIFVLLIGITGVMALFPIGVRLNQMCADDIISAMTVQNALAGVRTQTGLLARVKASAVDKDGGDALGWYDPPEDPYPPVVNPRCFGVDGITGSVQNVGDPTPGKTIIEYTGLKEPVVPVTSPPTTKDVTTPTTRLAVRAEAASPVKDYALLLFTSGEAMWKLHRLDNLATTGGSQFQSSDSPSVANFPADGVKVGDTFRLIGSRSNYLNRRIWATEPKNFYTDDSGTVNTTFQLGEGAVPGYGYLAIITRRGGTTNTFRVDILVYKGYDKTLPPEGNLPAIACYTTIMSGEMLK